MIKTKTWNRKSSKGNDVEFTIRYGEEFVEEEVNADGWKQTVEKRVTVKEVVDFKLNGKAFDGYIFYYNGTDNIRFKVGKREALYQLDKDVVEEINRERKERIDRELAADRQYERDHAAVYAAMDHEEG